MATIKSYFGFGDFVSSSSNCVVLYLCVIASLSIRPNVWTALKVQQDSLSNGGVIQRTRRRNASRDPVRSRHHAFIFSTEYTLYWMSFEAPVYVRNCSEIELISSVSKWKVEKLDKLLIMCLDKLKSLLISLTSERLVRYFAQQYTYILRHIEDINSDKYLF